MKFKVIIFVFVGPVLAALLLIQTHRSFRIHAVLAKSSEQDRVNRNLTTSRSIRGPMSASPRLAEAYGKTPLNFEANQGQADHRVKFLSRGSGYTLFLTSTEAVLALRKPSLKIPITQKLGERAPTTGGSNAAALRMTLLCASVTAHIEGLEPLPGRSNYFIGDDPSRWRTNIPTYGKVKYEGVYPGVDLVYYGNQQQLEYDFIVAPGADPGTIRLAIAGAKKLEAGAGGDLVSRTDFFRH